MASSAIRVKGAAELERAFMQLRREVLAELKPALRTLAGPVRVDAERLAVQNIRNIGAGWGDAQQWWEMRVGVGAGVVYVAPKSHRRGGSPRPNLGGLLMDRAMQPALDQNQEKIVAGLDALVSVSAARNGF